MAVIPMPLKAPRLRELRPQDRVERDRSSPTPRSGFTGLLVGTAIVAGSVVGLFMYDSIRPIASGAIPPPLPLIIAVEPATTGDAQPR